MKNKPIASLSVRKLFLTALVAGPLATLPAPLWALPGTTSANVSTTAGVTFQTAGSTLNVTAPNKAILTWTAFGSAGHTLNSGESVNFFLPDATSAVLNRVTGGTATTIDGVITSNGKVFILNPTGITVTNNANINVAGLVLSTVQEPDGYFAANGDLSYVGTTTAGVTVGAAGAATITTVGGNGNVYLVGNAVDVGATISGNLYVRSMGGTARLGQGSALSVNATSGAGGNLDVATAGGALELAGTNITTVKGNANLATANGNVSTTTASGFVANTAAKTTTINAGTGTITLDGDSVTVSATGGNTLITDANDLALGASTISGTLGVTSTGGSLSNSGAVTSTGAVSLSATAAGKNITVNTTGAVTFAALASNATGTVTINGTGNLTLPAIAAVKDLIVSTTGGTITAGAAISAATSASLSASGNVVLTGALTAPTATVTSTGGNITQTGAITSATKATFDAKTITLGTAGNDFAKLVLKNGASGITVVDTNAVILDTGTATSAGTTITAAGNITIGSAAADTLSFGGALSLTSTGGTISTTANNVTIGSDVTLNTTNANVSLGTAASTSSSFGKIISNVGTGTLTVIENTTLNLGTITAADVNARSLAGDIVNSGVVTATGTATFEAGSATAPGNVTMGQSNAIATTSITRAKDFTLKNTVATTVGTTNPVSGVATFNVAANNLTVTGDYTTLGYSASGASVVSITDSNALTLANATQSGTGTATITSTTSNLTLGAGINLTTTGLATFAATAGNVVDSVDTGISTFGNVAFNAGKAVTISHAGNNFGAVAITATDGDVTIREGGTLNLGAVTVTAANKNLTATADAGSIIQTGATSVGGTGAATFTASNGAVTLDNAANNVTSSVVITAKNASKLVNPVATKLGNVAVTGGGLIVDTSGAAGKAVTQTAASNTIWINGDLNVKTDGAAITLANTGNNFGKVTLDSTKAGATAAGANISIKEAGTLNISSVAAGTGGTFTAVSTAGSIIDTGNTGIVAGGAASLTATAGDITLDATGNAFGGTVTFNSGAATYLLDSVGNTRLGTGSAAAGALTVVNSANGVIDSDGPVSATGDTYFDAGTGSVVLNNVSNSFGALRFKAGAAGITIVQNSSMVLSAGSQVTASGPITLTSYGNISTGGTGGSNFTGTVTLNATGTITVSNPWFIGGVFTLNSPGAKDITALSKAGNLNNLNPVSTGGGTLTGPTTP
ncbi:MAG: filamentous hemagglutinin N-terminal domain-containing protein [Opitutae bacterium]|nr:filamentous hemagglutinin N-terminal domain-containing protein [Opitutae bacterium]